MANVPDYIKRVKAGEFRLMGFGHRVYKNYDPRARIIKQVADEVFEVTGKDPLLDIALELERIALEDDYFVKRRLYPNVDFYSGIIYQAMRFPVDMFPVMFAIPRTSGWLAQWVELLEDPIRRSHARDRSTSATGRETTFRSTKDKVLQIRMYKSCSLYPVMAFSSMRAAISFRSFAQTVPVM